MDTQGQTGEDRGSFGYDLRLLIASAIFTPIGASPFWSRGENTPKKLNTQNLILVAQFAGFTK